MRQGERSSRKEYEIKKERDSVLKKSRKDNGNFRKIIKLIGAEGGCL